MFACVLSFVCLLFFPPKGMCLSRAVLRAWHRDGHILMVLSCFCPQQGWDFIWEGQNWFRVGLRSRGKFMTLPGRERCGHSWQRPQVWGIPYEFTPGLGIGGIKILSLGKTESLLLVVSQEVSTDIPMVLGKCVWVSSCSSPCPSSAEKSW